MLITFKSRADADVIMFGEVGRQILVVIGKDPLEPQGIVTVEQLPEALAALQAAVETDRQERKADAPEDEDEDAARERALRAPVISFAQRAVPLQTMLQHSLREKTPVIWSASGTTVDK